MVDNGRRIDTLPIKTAAAPTDRVMVFYNAANNATAQTATLTIANLIGNAAPFSLQVDPANSNSMTVQGGTLFFSNSFGYYATSNNVLKRFTLSSF